MRSPIYSLLAAYIPGATIPPDVDPIPTISAAPSPTMTALAIMLFLVLITLLVLFFFVMENAKATKALTHELSVTNKALAQAMDPAYENSPAQSLNNLQVLLRNSAFFQSSTQSTIMRKYTSEANRLAGAHRTPSQLPLLQGEVPSAADSYRQLAIDPISVDPEAQHEHNQDAFIQSLLEQQEHFRKELDRLKSQNAHPSNRTNTRASQHPGLKRKLSVPPPAVRESDNSIGDPFAEGAYTRPIPDEAEFESSLDHPQGSDGAMMRDLHQQGVENGGPGDTDTYPNKHGETYAEENARMREQADAAAKQIRDEAEKDAE